MARRSAQLTPYIYDLLFQKILHNHPPFHTSDVIDSGMDISWREVISWHRFCSFQFRHCQCSYPGKTSRSVSPGQGHAEGFHSQCPPGDHWRRTGDGPCGRGYIAMLTVQQINDGLLRLITGLLVGLLVGLVVGTLAKKTWRRFVKIVSP